MDKYYGTYKYRISEILIAILSMILALVLCSILFGKRINSISSQLETLSESDYNYIYVLNYPIMLDNEYIYPDTGIMLYSDSGQTKRIASTILMQEMGQSYDEHILSCDRCLGESEISISQNIADAYGLNVGMIIYAQYPHVIDPVEMTIVSIMDVNYDFENPDVDNDIGVAVVGYNENYCNSTINKALCFSRESLSSEISDYQQVLDSIISKSDNQKYVVLQSRIVFVVEVILVISAIIIAEVSFFSNSTVRLKRLFLKGISKKQLIMVPFVEHFLFMLVPVVLSSLLVARYIRCNSIVTIVYYGLYISIPLIVSVFIGVMWFYKTLYSVR